MMTRASVKPILALAFCILGFAASGAALAQHRGGHAHFGVYLGVPLYGAPYYPSYYAPYYPPPYYYPPASVGYSSPPVYIEQGTAQAAPAPTQPQTQAQGDWYYCAASKGYYPYVAECPSGWQRVPASPPSNPPR